MLSITQGDDGSDGPDGSPGPDGEVVRATDWLLVLHLRGVGGKKK